MRSKVGLLIPSPKVPYGNVVLADSPVGYWPLTETSGTNAADLSGNSRNGTYTGSPTLGGSAPAALTCAPTFNGSNQYVTVPSNAAFTPSGATFTAECWARSTTSTVPKGLMGKGTYSSTCEWLMEQESWGSPYGTLAMACYTTKFDASLNGPGWVSPDNVVTTNLNNWVHYVVVWSSSGATVTGYINGTAVGSRVTQGGAMPTNLGGTFDMARNLGGLRYWQGQVCHVALYSTALSAARVSAHYAAGIA